MSRHLLRRHFRWLIVAGAAVAIFVSSIVNAAADDPPPQDTHPNAQAGTFFGAVEGKIADMHGKCNPIPLTAVGAGAEIALKTATKEGFRLLPGVGTAAGLVATGIQCYAADVALQAAMKEQWNKLKTVDGKKQVLRYIVSTGLYAELKSMPLSSDALDTNQSGDPNARKIGDELEAMKDLINKCGDGDDAACEAFIGPFPSNELRLAVNIARWSKAYWTCVAEMSWSDVADQACLGLFPRNVPLWPEKYVAPYGNTPTGGSGFFQGLKDLLQNIANAQALNPCGPDMSCPPSSLVRVTDGAGRSRLIDLDAEVSLTIVGGRSYEVVGFTTYRNLLAAMTPNADGTMPTIAFWTYAYDGVKREDRFSFSRAWVEYCEKYPGVCQVDDNNELQGPGPHGPFDPPSASTPVRGSVFDVRDLINKTRPPLLRAFDRDQMITSGAWRQLFAAPGTSQAISADGTTAVVSADRTKITFTKPDGRKQVQSLVAFGPPLADGSRPIIYLPMVGTSPRFPDGTIGYQQYADGVMTLTARVDVDGKPDPKQTRVLLVINYRTGERIDCTFNKNFCVVDGVPVRKDDKGNPIVPHLSEVLANLDPSGFGFRGGNPPGAPIGWGRWEDNRNCYFCESDTTIYDPASDIKPAVITDAHTYRKEDLHVRGWATLWPARSGDKLDESTASGPGGDCTPRFGARRVAFYTRNGQPVLNTLGCIGYISPSQVNFRFPPNLGPGQYYAIYTYGERVVASTQWFQLNGDGSVTTPTTTDSGSTTTDVTLGY